MIYLTVKLQEVKGVSVAKHDPIPSPSDQTRSLNSEVAPNKVSCPVKAG